MKKLNILALAATACFAFSCTAHTLSTHVTMGYSNLSLGGYCNYKDKYYTVVKYYFTGTDEECTLTASKFSITYNDKSFKGQKFVKEPKGGILADTDIIGETTKLNNYVYVMYNDNGDGYKVSGATGTINDTKINQYEQTSITFKW